MPRPCCWRFSGGAADLIDEVRKKQGWGEATIKTLLGRLMRKGVIVTERIDKRQRYSSMIDRDAYLDAECQALADRLFDGDKAALARHIIERETGKLS